MAASKPLANAAGGLYALLGNMLGTAAGSELGALISKPNNYWMIAAFLGTCGAQTLFQRWLGAKDSKASRQNLIGEIEDLLAKFQRVQTRNDLAIRDELLAAIKQHGGKGDPNRLDQLLAFAAGTSDDIDQLIAKIDAIDAGVLAAINDQADYIEDVVAATNATVDENRERLIEVDRKLEAAGVEDAMIARLLKELDAKDARIAELESANSLRPEEVVRDAVAAVVDEPNVDFDTLTGDDLQAALIAKSNRLETEERETTNDLVETDRRILHYAQLRSELDEVEYRIDRILTRRPDDIDAVNRRGYLRKLRGDLSHAEADFQRVADLAGDDESWSAVAYGNLGLIYDSRGELDRAEEMHLKSLAIEERLGHQEGLAIAHGNLGIIYSKRGDWKQAEQMYEWALAIEEQLNRREYMADQYGNLAVIYSKRGELDRAEELHRKALDIHEQLGRREGIAAEYANLGLIYQTRGELERAEEAFRQSLEIGEALGLQRLNAKQYGNLGVLYQSRGNLNRAEEMYRKALEINEDLGFREDIANQYGNLGVVCRERGERTRAEEMHFKALEIYEELGNREGIARQYSNLGLIYRTRCEFDRAEEMHRNALKINKQLGRREGVAIQYANLGGLYEVQLRFVEAREFGAKSRDLYSEIGAPHTVERLQTWLDSLPS